jgi:preprotein translocase subunit SecB
MPRVKKKRTDSPEQVAAVKGVARNAWLKSVSLAEMSADLEVPAEQVATGDHEYQAETKTTAQLVETVAEVFVSLTLFTRVKGSEKPWGRFAARYRLIYQFEGAPPATEDVDRFARMNGVYNAWPYLRELIQSTTLRMGLSPLTLPLYKVVSPVGPAKGPASG